jgi:phosphatidylglycerophosphatase A
MTWARRIATCGGIGLIPLAPGTWASAATVPLAWGLHYLGGFALVGAATVAVTVAGYLATAHYLNGRAEDPSEIVIDEVAGMMIALWPLSIGLTLAGSAPHIWPWPGWVLGFVLFRFFDIVKPPPVGWADRIEGPLGVMLDDLIAGALTAALATLAAGISHGWL